jgi:type IV secretory pathway VirB10-like protein
VPLTKETEFILLACDGLWDKFSNEDAVEFVRTRVQTQVPTVQIVEEIVKEAYNLGSTDNITAILVVFNHSIANKTMRRAGAAHTAEDHHATQAPNGSVPATPNKSGKKDKTPKKEPKGVTKTSAEPPQVIPMKKPNKSADKRVSEQEHKTSRTDESSQSKTSDEKKTELASPKSDRSVSRESDKSPRKTKDDKEKHKKHKKDESHSQSAPSITVAVTDKDDAVLHSSSADSLGKDKS